MRFEVFFDRGYMISHAIFILRVDHYIANAFGGADRNSFLRGPISFPTGIIADIRRRMDTHARWSVPKVAEPDAAAADPGAIRDALHHAAVAASGHVDDRNGRRNSSVSVADRTWVECEASAPSVLGDDTAITKRMSEDAPSANTHDVVGETVKLLDGASASDSAIAASTQQQRQQQHKPQPHPRCSSSFNENLKTALSSYNSSRAVLKDSNNPAPPVPPPFLSHSDECTIKTALAFAMVKARIRNRKDKETLSLGVRGGRDSLPGTDRNGGSVLTNKMYGSGVGGTSLTFNLTRDPMCSITASSDTGGICRGNLPRPILGLGGKPSSFLGGLLSPPPSRLVTSVSSSYLANDNVANKHYRVLERQVKHVRDVLKLAVSTVLPLYMGALEVNSCDLHFAPGARSLSSESNDDEATTLEQSEDGSVSMKRDDASLVGRRPCAVYDFEAAIKASAVVPFLSRPSTGGDRHHQATLDGLCQHIVIRLSTLIRDEAMQSSDGGLNICAWRVSNAISAVESIRNNGSRKCKGENNDDNSFDSNGVFPTVVTDKSQGNTTTAMPRGQQVNVHGGNSIVRDAIVKLIYNDLIGDAHHHGSQSSQSSFAREYAVHRIEKVMAVCHVLHRLLFLDKGCCLGTECVVVICSILNDLYLNQYCGKRLYVGETCEGMDVSNGAFKFDKNRPPDSAVEEHRQHHHIQKDKGKYQVISPRWSDLYSASNINAKHERRRQSVDIPAQRRCNSPNHTRNQSCNEIAGTNKLPRIGDVLAVNLLRLLEGAAAIRLHHRQDRVLSSCHASCRTDEDYLFDNASSMAATEVLTEIRSTIEHDLLIPLQVEDGANFFYNEKIRSAEDARGDKNGGDVLVLLQPGAKMMLRLHLFGLMTKIALYERL